MPNPLYDTLFAPLTDRDSPFLLLADGAPWGDADEEDTRDAEDDGYMPPAKRFIRICCSCCCSKKVAMAFCILPRERKQKP